MNAKKVIIPLRPVKRLGSNVATHPALGDSLQDEYDKAFEPKLNNILTASRMNCAGQCWRKHFWQCEIGLRKIVESSPALRFGSAWARAMEARWLGKSYKLALAAAVPEGSTMMDEYAIATLSALLAVYYEIYGKKEQFGKLHPEVKFQSELVEGFTAQGVIDGLGSLADGRSGIIESKTTADSLAPDSDFWLRLVFNNQVYQYIVEARKLGWDIATTYYDVTRKPQIGPKQISDVDDNGKKIVLDATGNRVFKKDGEPRESGDTAKGYVVQAHVENPEEFGKRLYEDARSRPEFYFARREVPVIDDQLVAFEVHRLLIVALIGFFRSKEHNLKFYRPDENLLAGLINNQPRDPEAWPRNVAEHTCDFCPYKSFCLSNIPVDINNLPDGFAIQPFNPELK